MTTLPPGRRAARIRTAMFAARDVESVIATDSGDAPISRANDARSSSIAPIIISTV